MSRIPKKLREVWTLKPDEHVSIHDLKVIDPIIKLDYFYQTHLLPQPWWGNIEDPEVLFLSLNPSYVPIIDDEDENYIQSFLKENLRSKSINWFDHKYIKDRNGQNRKTSSFQWWENKLKGLHSAGISNDEEKIYNKIGFFQLCGYHSREYRPMAKKCFVGVKELPTQTVVVEHVRTLLNKYDPYVVIIWGKKEWEDACGKFNPEKLVILNEKNTRNPSFDKAPENYKPITNIIHNIIKK